MQLTGHRSESEATVTVQCSNLELKLATLKDEHTTEQLVKKICDDWRWQWTNSKKLRNTIIQVDKWLCQRSGSTDTDKTQPHTLLSSQPLLEDCDWNSRTRLKRERGKCEMILIILLSNKLLITYQQQKELNSWGKSARSHSHSHHLSPLESILHGLWITLLHTATDSNGHKWRFL